MKVKTIVKFNDLVENTLREIGDVFEINDEERLNKLLGLGYVEILDIEPTLPEQEPETEPEQEPNIEPETEPSEGGNDNDGSNENEPEQKPEKVKKGKK